MDFSGKVALVTGASVGIGKEIAERLVSMGMRVVGCARHLDKLKNVADAVNKTGPGEMFPIKCDLQKEEDIMEMFLQIRKQFGTLHVLVNNAGLIMDEPLLSGSTDVWRTMLDVNVLAMAICSREAYKLMKESGVTTGNFIFIGSTVSHKYIPYKFLNFYTITKHAVKAMVEIFRREVQGECPGMRCSSVTPGIVRTQAAAEIFPPDVLQGIFEAAQAITSSDVADAVVYVLKAPSHVNINEIVPDSLRGSL